MYKQRIQTFKMKKQEKSYLSTFIPLFKKSKSKIIGGDRKNEGI